MSCEDIEYGGHAFSENTFVITWAQLFLIRMLSEDKNRPEWTDVLLKEWPANAAITMYKYIFDERLLNVPAKIEWSRKFMDEAIVKINKMTEEEFSRYVDDFIRYEENFDRVKGTLNAIRLMLDGQDPAFLNKRK